MTIYKYIGMNRNSGLNIGDIDHIRQSISDVLTTPQGSRVMRRDYGSLISTLIDQSQNPALRLKMMAAVYGAVMRWEPRVTLNAISISTQIDGKMSVDLTRSRTDSDSTDFRETLNVRRDQSYHKTTIGGIIKIIAERNKLMPTLNKTMSDLAVDHIDQTNESDGNLITRLAKQYGAIAAVKNGNLLFIKQGQAKTASGKTIPVMTIIRSLGDGYQFSMADRGAYTGVVANWLNTRTTEKPVVKVKRKRKSKTAAAKPKEPEEKQGEYLIGTDENVLTLRTTYASKNNAQRAAKSNWERLQRGAAKFSIQLAKGRADLYPEVPVKVTGFKKQIDEADWTLVTVTHSVSDTGFTTALELEVKIDDLDME